MRRWDRSRARQARQSAADRSRSYSGIAAGRRLKRNLATIARLRRESRARRARLTKRAPTWIAVRRPTDPRSPRRVAITGIGRRPRFATIGPRGREDGNRAACGRPRAAARRRHWPRTFAVGRRTAMDGRVAACAAPSGALRATSRDLPGADDVLLAGPFVIGVSHDAVQSLESRQVSAEQPAAGGPSGQRIGQAGTKCRKSLLANPLHRGKPHVGVGIAQ